MVFALLAGALLLLKSDRGRRTEVVLAAGVFLAIAALFKEVAVLFTPGVRHTFCGSVGKTTGRRFNGYSLWGCRPCLG